MRSEFLSTNRDLIPESQPFHRESLYVTGTPSVQALVFVLFFAWTDEDIQDYKLPSEAMNLMRNRK